MISNMATSPATAFAAGFIENRRQSEVVKTQPVLEYQTHTSPKSARAFVRRNVRMTVRMRMHYYHLHRQINALAVAVSDGTSSATASFPVPLHSHCVRRRCAAKPWLLTCACLSVCTPAHDTNATGCEIKLNAPTFNWKPFCGRHTFGCASSRRRIAQIEMFCH